MTPDPLHDDPLATARRLKRQADLLWWDTLLIGASLMVGTGVWVAALVGAGS